MTHLILRLRKSGDWVGWVGSASDDFRTLMFVLSHPWNDDAVPWMGHPTLVMVKKN